LSPPPQLTGFERNSALTNHVSRPQKRAFLYQVLEYNDSFVMTYLTRDFWRLKLLISPCMQNWLKVALQF